MKYHPQRMPRPTPHPADPMPHIHPIHSSHTLHRPMMNSKNYRIALAQENNLGARLHPRSLLGQNELTARKILAWLRQKNRNLQRKHVLAIQILVQAVVVTRSILEQQWSWASLAGFGTALQILGVLSWI